MTAHLQANTALHLALAFAGVAVFAVLVTAAGPLLFALAVAGARTWGRVPAVFGRRTEGRAAIGIVRADSA